MADDHVRLQIALQAAIPLEIARVTDASMELMLLDQQRARTATRQLHDVAARISALVESASGRDLTESERSEEAALKDQHAELTRYLDHGTVVGLIGSHTDEVFYSRKHSTHSAETFAAIARGIAHLAHQDGGVRFAGIHWCAGAHRFGRPCGPDPTDWPDETECHPDLKVIP